MVVEHVILQLKSVIETNKQQRSLESLRVYKTVPNIISPPAASQLQRATARVFGLGSREGIKAAQMRRCARRVDMEGGIGDQSRLFDPAERKKKADWIAREPMRRNARGFWKRETRPSPCTKNTVVMPDKSIHPVHWLEKTIDQFYAAFITVALLLMQTRRQCLMWKKDTTTHVSSWYDMSLKAPPLSPFVGFFPNIMWLV